MEVSHSHTNKRHIWFLLKEGHHFGYVTIYCDTAPNCRHEEELTREVQDLADALANYTERETR